MGEGFQFIDIILFAMIAAFLALRLRSVLGRRDGHEGGHRDPFKPAPEKPSAKGEGDENVVRLPDRTVDETESEAQRDAKLKAFGGGDEALSAGLTQIRVADSAFDPETFVNGARVAFEMVLDAFAAGDTGVLKNILSPEVFGNFQKAIRDRQEAGETLKYTLVGIRKADIVEAYMDGRNATVTMKFISEQINATLDRAGAVVSGDLNKVVDVTDFWTFQRDTRSRDPNWTLVATRSPE